MLDLNSQLGLPEDAKLLIIHADDAGLSHSENLATIQCLERGYVNSCSVMVTCPWFFEMANYLNLNSHFDHGIHLTLTCEWHNFKFGPVLPAKDVPSLVDDKGYFFANRKTLLKNARVEEVRLEITAQIERGLYFGLKPSHLDSHMYSLGISQEIFQVYKEMGKKYRLPTLLNGRLLSEISGLNPEGELSSEDFVIPHIHYGDFESFSKNKLSEFYTKTLEDLQPGLHMILIHPALDDLEMQGITKDHPTFGSAWRQVDTDFFSSDICGEILKKNKIELITWKQIGQFLYS